MFTYILIFIAAHVFSVTMGSIRTNNLFFQNEINVGTVASCAYLTSKRLFVPSYGLVVMCNGYDALDDAVVRVTMTDDAPLVVDRPVQTVHGRLPKYIAIEHDRFSKSRESLLSGKESLRYFQYLFVTKATREQIDLFARDLWNAGFRDVAFLTINGVDKTAIVLPSVTGNEIILSNVGFCSSSRNNIEQISPFSTDQNRFCSEDGCVLKYEQVRDSLSIHWYHEDRLTLKRSYAHPQSVNTTVVSMHRKIIDRFGIDNNVTIISSWSLNWTDAADRLINGDIDILIARAPENIELLESLEVVCNAGQRNILYADVIKHRKLSNDIRKMLTSFHHTVWLVVILLMILYILLLCCLRKFASMGLIKEGLDFMHVFAIMMGQSITFPRKFGLRLILLIWMVFSFYMTLIYSSVFTTSLSQLEVEERFTNLEQLRNSRRYIAGPVAGRDLLRNDADADLTFLFERYKVMNPEEAIEALYRNEAVVIMQRNTKDMLNWVHRSNRSRRIYKIARSHSVYPIVILSRKGYRYTRLLRDINTLYIETGQITKKSMQLRLRDKKFSQYHNISIDYLTVENVIPLINTFFWGLGIGSLIFIVELIYPNVLKLIC